MGSSCSMCGMEGRSTQYNVLVIVGSSYGVVRCVLVLA